MNRTRITAEWVRERVEHIRSIAHDDERAHGNEDGLARTVLRHIADDSTDPWAAEIAAAALETDDIDFARWCA